MIDGELPKDIEAMTPAERFDRSPRPLNFVRVRLHRGGQAEYIKQMLLDEQEDLFLDLTELRSAGKPEDDPKVVECRANLRHVIGALGDVNRGLIELVGPDIP
jgi:hypothetical protein